VVAANPRQQWQSPLHTTEGLVSLSDPGIIFELVSKGGCIVNAMVSASRLLARLLVHFPGSTHSI
jgi:hypothetical protein